ncbi:MAG TPA: alpha/beta hydrolase [Longimicrobiales bacterium]
MTPPRMSGPRQSPRARLLAGLAITERTLDLDGVTTPVLDVGSGPPLLVLHGPGEFAPRWAAVIPRLADGYRVIVPDLPGHGSSRVHRGELTVPRVIDWLDAVIERTCAEPPALVGHILGGAIAARFALERPQRLRSLVLVDSLGLAPFRPAPRFALALFTFMAIPGERSYQHLMSQCEYDRDALASRMGVHWDAVRDYAIERARDPHAKAALRALMRNVGVPAIPPADLGRIAVPTALIWGRHDRALRVSIAESASARYGWPLRVIEDTADDAPFERPEAFVAALRHLLESRLTATTTGVA